ncbi:hypothetical protein TNCV_2166301 [Trichonephila clavipes]|nr:hypothetical protein TNCV_2166301 [Trichonephila clavipes]
MRAACDRPRGGFGSPVVKVSDHDRHVICSSTPKDLPCRVEMHVKSAELKRPLVGVPFFNGDFQKTCVPQLLARVIGKIHDLDDCLVKREEL